MRVDDFGPLWPQGWRFSQFELEPDLKGAITPWQLACEKALSPRFWRRKRGPLRRRERATPYHPSRHQPSWPSMRSVARGLPLSAGISSAAILLR